MNRATRYWMPIGICALVTLGTAIASTASPEPEPADMARAIEMAPELEIARAQLASAQSMAHIETTSARPWLARGGTQTRSVTGNLGVTGQTNYQEWDVSLEHDVRLPGKRQLDRSVAGAQIARAAAIVEDTQRTVTVAVLEDWYHCVAATARAKRAADEQRTATILSQSVEKRRSAGEAAQLDATLAAAELAAMDAEVAATNEALRSAQDLLVARGLPPSCASATLKDAPPLVSRAAIDPSKDPAVRAASAAAELAAFQAERAQAERLPDPSVGIRYAQERGGLERIAGIFVSVPLPSGRAAAEAAHAAALARIAESERRQTEWKTTTRINSLLARLRTARAQWQPLDAAARLRSDAAERILHAYNLGEVDLDVALQDQRTARAARALADDALIEFWHAESVAKAQYPATDDAPK
jgi:cobalt-zinc-cadmium efflux system outer membrane protein